MKSLTAKTVKSSDKVVLTETAEAMFLNLAVTKYIADVENGETAEAGLKAIQDHYAKLGVHLAVNSYVGKPEEKTKANAGDTKANIGISWYITTMVDKTPIQVSLGTAELLKVGYLLEAVKNGTAKLPTA